MSYKISKYSHLCSSYHDHLVRNEEEEEEEDVGENEEKRKDVV